MKRYLLKSMAVAVIAAAVMVTSLPVFADSVEDANRFVKMCDTDKDGMVSKAEVMKRAADMMKKMAADKNGMFDAKKTMALILELQRVFEIKHSEKQNQLRCASSLAIPT